MTSKTDKLRAVFLTALMIGSVFAAGVAFTGGAAAITSTSADDVDIASGTQDQTVTYTAEAGTDFDGSGSGTASVTFDTVEGLSFSGVTLASATQDGSSVSTAVTASQTSSTVTVDISETDVSQGSDIAIELTVSVDASSANVATTEYSITSDGGTAGGSSAAAAFTITNSNNPGFANTGAVADVSDSDTTQEISNVQVDLASEGQDNVDVYFDVSPLTTNGIDIDSLNVDISNDDVTNGVVNDQNVNDNLVRVTIDADDGANSFTIDQFNLTQLDAAGASANTGLSYGVGFDDTTAAGSTGTFAVVDSDTTDETTFNNGGIVFQGQTAAFDAADGDDNYASGGYTLYEKTSSSPVSGSPVRSLDRNSGFVNVSTSGLSTGQTYFISNDGSDSSDIEFTVREQDFDVAFDGDSVANDDTGIDVTWTSTNRQGTTYNVTVDSSSLDDSELVNVFDDNYDVTDFDTDSEDGVEVLVPSGTENTAAANFSGIDAGSYTFDFDVTDTSASDSESLNVTSAADADSSFVSISQTARGDVSTVNVSLTSATQATVQIGSDSVGYLANVTVQDGNGDGYVAFDVNTYTMGNNTDVDASQPGNAFSAVAEDDSVTAVEFGTADLENPIADGNYRATVRTGDTASATADDVSRLTITESNGMIAQNIWTAPGGTAMDSVIDAVSQDDSIAEGDYVVHEVEAEGVFGVLQSTNQDTATDQLEAALGTELALSVTQTDATTQLNRQPKTLDYATALADGDATVVADAENNTFYVVADTSNLGVVEDGRSIQWDDDAFNASVTLTEATNLVDSNSTTSAEFSADALETSLSMDTYNVTNAENQSISGETTAADGTEFNVLVESLETEGDGFIEADNPAVAEDGELTAEVDFTDASVGDTFSVSLENPDGSEADSAQGNVVESTGDGTDETTTEAPDTTTEAPDTTTEAPDTTTEAPDTTTEAPDTTTEESADTTTEEGGDGGSDGGSIPGFGVGIALVAVLGAALLALRE